MQSAPEGLIDYQDERDVAIAWEFNLWKNAETARFEAELKKLQQERFQAVRDEFSARSAALREEYAAKLSAIEDLEASIDDAIATTIKKTAEYKLQRQGLSREAKLIKENLQKQITEAETVANESRAEAEAILAAQNTKADQMESQARFFYEELQKVQKRREQESAQIIKFIASSANDPGQQAYNNFLELQREMDIATSKRDFLEAELAELNAQLQTLMTNIAILRRGLPEWENTD